MYGPNPCAPLLFARTRLSTAHGPVLSRCLIPPRPSSLCPPPFHPCLPGFLRLLLTTMCLSICHGTHTFPATLLSPCLRGISASAAPRVQFSFPTCCWSSPPGSTAQHGSAPPHPLARPPPFPKCPVTALQAHKGLDKATIEERNQSSRGRRFPNKIERHMQNISCLFQR